MFLQYREASPMSRDWTVIEILGQIDFEAALIEVYPFQNQIRVPQESYLWYTAIPFRVISLDAEPIDCDDVTRRRRNAGSP